MHLHQENQASHTDRGAVVVHGGAGHPADHADGCEAAAQAALAALRAGKQAREAAIAAVMVLEDDGRFNAGRGALFGLDGETVEYTASLMDTRGGLGAVAGARNVRHPVLLADAVANTPHTFIAGDGADRLARLLGLEEARHDREHALQQWRETMDELQQAEPVLKGVDNAAFRKLWNYPMPWAEAVRRHGHGTVGAAVRDAEGGFAVATSSGGVAPGLLGRVGDTPIIGSGFYCGQAGAVGATGIGEAIMRQLLAHTVYSWIEQGRPLQQALDDGIALFDSDMEVGLIAITPHGHATACNQQMPTAAGTA